METEGRDPAEAAVRLKARRKALGNTQEITVVYPPLHYTLNYEGSVEIHCKWLSGLILLKNSY